MKEDEAVKILSDKSCKQALYRYKREDRGTKYREAKQMGIDALKRMIPRKPKHYYEEAIGHFYECPVCKFDVEEEQICCEGCYQILDWRENEW